VKFLNNKYTKWYYNILSAPNKTGYTELHHILPKSLGGTNSTENLVHLSLRQHYIVHLLLPKMVSSQSDRAKMLFALRCMTNFDKTKRRYKPSSRIVELMKINIRNQKISEEHRQNIVNGQSGKKLSKEHRAAISAGLQGKIHSVETKQLISQSNLGLKRSTETRKNISNSRKGKPLSAEHKNKLSVKIAGRKVSKDTCMKIKASQEKFKYNLLSPTHLHLTISNLKDWCKANSLPYSTFSLASREGKKMKNGWTVSRSLI